MEHIIDAKGKSIGRVAAKAAHLLLGKTTGLAKNRVSADKVKIINSGHVLLSAKKMRDKKYVRYSGYPGGLKEESLKQVIEKRGYPEVLRRAVLGMLPKNKLQRPRMKNLIIT